jgi:hypothetical protein
MRPQPSRCACLPPCCARCTGSCDNVGCCVVVACVSFVVGPMHLVGPCGVLWCHRATGTVGTVQAEAGNGSPFRSRPTVPKPPLPPTDADTTDIHKLKAMTLKFSAHNRDAASSHRNRADRERGLVKTLGGLQAACAGVLGAASGGRVGDDYVHKLTRHTLQLLPRCGHARGGAAHLDLR